MVFVSFDSHFEPNFYSRLYVQHLSKFNLLENVICKIVATLCVLRKLLLQLSPQKLKESLSTGILERTDFYQLCDIYQESPGWTKTTSPWAFPSIVPLACSFQQSSESIISLQ